MQKKKWRYMCCQILCENASLEVIKINSYNHTIIDLTAIILFAKLLSNV